MNEPVPPPAPELPPPIAGAAGWLSAVKGLTITNALVVVMLVIAGIPAYGVYRLLSDEELLARFLSNYRVVKVPGSSVFRQAKQRGEPYVWSLNTGFAFEGSTRWSVGVLLESEPNDEEQKSYCATLQLIVDYLHGADGSELPNIVWQYKDVEGREGQKGER